MSKKKKNILLIILLIILILMIVFCFNMLKNTYAYSSIIYRDDGSIELYANDLVNLKEEEYDDVVQITFRTEMPDSANLDLLKTIPNIKDIYFSEIDIDDLTFLNDINSNFDISLYFACTTINFQNINNNKITSLNIGNSVVKNFSSIENLNSLKEFGFGETIGYEKLDYTKFPNLTSLTLCSYVDDFEELIDSIPNVTSLSLAGSNIQNKDTNYLKKLSNLTNLNLNQTFLTDIDFVNDLPNLETLVLPWAVTDLSPVYNLKNLQSLNWEAYTELFVTQDLVNYLDEHNIWHYDYDSNINTKINDILMELEVDTSTNTEEALEKIVRYIIKNTGTDLSNANGNSSNLDILINQNMGVCYQHSIALYTLAKVLGINDIYATSGINMSLTDIYVGNEFNDTIDHNFYVAHAWNIVNINGIWYGIDAAQMNQGNFEIDEELFKANFLKNPFKDDEYDINYANNNYYDFNYFFSARNLETDGILNQVQTFEFKDIFDLNIKNHVIYDYDVNDTNAANLCNKVLENYDCKYYDVDENDSISFGDKIIITKNNVEIDTFILSTESYVEPRKLHLGRPKLEYTNYPDIEIYSTVSTQYFNDGNPLEIKLLGENYDETTMYETKIEILNYSNNEIIYTNTLNVNGKNINDGFSYSISSDTLIPKEQRECSEFGCETDYLINIYVSDAKRELYLNYDKINKNKFNITIDSNDNISIYPDDVIIVEENENKDFEISAKLGYRINSIKVNGIENINNYNNNKLLIENITEDINIVIETVPEIYEFIQGNNSVYLNKEMTFKINGPLEIFSKLYINEEVLDSSNYKLEKGSTIITLSNDYLKKLSNGTYKLVANYSNGTNATATFIVNDKSSESNLSSNENSNNITSSPKTYDGIILYFILGILSLIGIIVISIIKIIKKN